MELPRFLVLLGVLALLQVVWSFDLNDPNAEPYDEEKHGPIKVGRGPDDDFEEIFADAPLVKSKVKKIFGKADLNKDKKVSLKELIRYTRKMREEMSAPEMKIILKEVDANGDGQLSHAEIVKERDEHPKRDEEGREVPTDTDFEDWKFSVADQDEDGYLDLEEMVGYFAPESVDAVQEKMSAVSFKQMDTNEDGKISQDEVFPPEQAEALGGKLDGVDLKEVFNLHDEDDDGYFDLQELKDFESGFSKVKRGLEELFEICDQDQDGFFTQKEMLDTMEKWEATKNDAVIEMRAWQDFYDQEAEKKEEL